MKQLIELLNNGWDIKFSSIVKRMDSDWKIRFCWKAQRNDESYESDWEGFETPEDCTKDAYDKLIKIKQPEKEVIEISEKDLFVGFDVSKLIEDE